MALFPPIDATPDQVREALLPLRNDFAVAVVAAENAFAVGAIVRVAHSFLAREIVVVGRAPYYPKASMGMEKYESIVVVDDLEGFFAHVAGRPVWCLEKDRAERSITAVESFPKDVVLTFGSERFGLPKELLDRADAILGIPIYGINHSLPVAIAAGIAMHEWARRHYRTQP